MFTTDGATPSFYAERGVIGGALRVAKDLDPMRALQMATIDPASYLNLDEQLGGIAPGRRATLNVLAEIGEWQPEVVYVRGREAAREGRLTAPLPDLRYGPGYALAKPDPSLFAPLTGTHPVARYESAVINRRHDREVTPQDTQAMLVARDGSWVTKGVVEHFIATPGFATSATTSLHVLVLGHDQDAMARAAARLAEQGGGFVFDGGWSAPLEIDGLISSGGFDKSVTIDRELSKQMSAAGYPFHDPLYSLLFASGDFLPEIRLTPCGVIEVKSRAVLADTVRP
jgi:adenine deaminase